MHLNYNKAEHTTVSLWRSEDHQVLSEEDVGEGEKAEEDGSLVSPIKQACRLNMQILRYSDNKYSTPGIRRQVYLHINSREHLDDASSTSIKPFLLSLVQDFFFDLIDSLFIPI